MMFRWTKNSAPTPLVEDRRKRQDNPSLRTLSLASSGFRSAFASAAVVVLALSSQSAVGQVTIRGRLVFDGDVPAPKRIEIPALVFKERREPKKPAFDRSLVVDPETKALADAFVWIVPPKSKTGGSPAAKSDTSNGEKPFEFRFTDDGQISPRCAVIRPGQKAQLDLRSGPRLVRLHAYPLKNNSWTTETRLDDKTPLEFPDGWSEFPERVPFPVKESISWTWARVNLFVTDASAVVTSADGTFALRSAETKGQITLRVWQEKDENVEMEAAQGKVAKPGHLTLDLAGKDVDLGDVKVRLKRREK